ATKDVSPFATRKLRKSLLLGTAIATALVFATPRKAQAAGFNGVATSTTNANASDTANIQITAPSAIINWGPVNSGTNLYPDDGINIGGTDYWNFLPVTESVV